MIDGLKLFTFLSIVNKDTNYGEVLEFQHNLGNKNHFMFLFQETYWISLNNKIVETICSLPLTVQGGCQPFQVFNFTTSQTVFAEQHMTYLLALSHAVWHHAGIGQLSQLSV